MKRSTRPAVPVHPAEAAEIRDFLLLNSKSAPSPELLRATGLAGYAYVTLTRGSPVRAGLRADYLEALGRHQRIRQELAGLIASWRRNGIDALLFKGFHVAEFIYPAPGMRFHGDVDICVRPAHESEAMRIAEECGWTRELDSRALRRLFSHGVCNLYRSGKAAQVDLHRLVLHSRTRYNRLQRRITAAVWNDARVLKWEDTEVHVPTPVDALLILVLQRAWGEGWGLKVHDVLDVRFLAQKIGAESWPEPWQDRVRARARELGCEKTFERFMDRCDPESRRLGPLRPTAVQRWRWNVGVAADRPFLWCSEAVRRLGVLPVVVRDVAGGYLHVLRARRALRQQKDIGRLLESVSAGPMAAGRSSAGPMTAARSSELARHRTVLGIRRALRLFTSHPGGLCLVRSLAIYSALRRQGWPVVFVSGVRRSDEGVTGHAWVELDDGSVLPELRQENNGIYRVNVRYPGPNADSSDTGVEPSHRRRTSTRGSN